MNDEFDDRICKLLTTDNVDPALTEEEISYMAWRNENIAYIEMLEQVVKKEKEDEALKEFLGF